MKRLLAGLAAATGAALFALAPFAAFAATSPCPFSEPLTHGVGGWFQNCPDMFPVTAFAYALSGSTTTNAQATINSGTVDMICEDSNATSSASGFCQPDAGILGDGKITVSYDWNNTVGNNIGCPDNPPAAHFGRNIVQVIANDGSSLLVSVGFSTDLGQYNVDFAQVVGANDPITGLPVPVPLSCNFAEGGLKITSQTATPTTYQVTVHVPAPLMHTDCDPNTFGNVGNPLGFTPTCDATVPTTAPGKIYTTTLTCGKSPDMVLNSTANPWVAGPALDGNGNATLTVNRPAAGSGLCAFIAASGMVTGLETLAATGAIEVQGQGAPSPKALGVAATRSGGNVVVSFRTDSEIELAGFNILADVQGGKNRIQVNSQMIAPKGVSGAGASYTVSIPQGSLKGAKTIYVESVTTSGAKILSDPARL